LLFAVEELVQLKKENEQLKSENMRFRSIIDGAGSWIVYLSVDQ